MFEAMLAAGCDHLARDHLDATLLHYAASGGNWDVIRRLLELGCDKHAATKYGRSPLHYAAYSEP